MKYNNCEHENAHVSYHPAIRLFIPPGVHLLESSRVVLVDATRTVRVEKRLPILGAIPYIGKMFRNTGIGVEKLEGELTIKRSDIQSIQFEK